MSVTSRIAKNTLFMWTSNIIGKSLGFVLLAYLTRKLGVTDFGRYSLVGIIIFYFHFISNIGIAPLSIREISRARENATRLFNNILTLRTVLGIVSLLLLQVFCRFIGYDRELTAYLTIASIGMIFSIISNCFDSVFISFEKMKYPAIFGAITVFLYTSLAIGALEMGMGLYGIFAAGAVVAFCTMVVYSCIVWKKILTFKPAIEWTVWKHILMQALPFGILMILGLIHSKIDIFMLSKIDGPLEGMKAIGYYSPPHRVFAAVMLLIESMRTAVFPMISLNFTKNMNLVIRTYYIAFKGILFFFSVPFLLFFFFLSEPFIVVVFSSLYRESNFTMQILAVVYAIQAFNLPIITVLMNSKNLFQFVPMVALAAVINISLNLLLIPRASFNGAAVATLITIVFIFFVKLYYIRKTFNGLFPLPGIPYRFFLLCAGIFAYIYIVQHYNLFIAAFTGIGLYYVSLFRLRIVDKEDLDRLKRLKLFQRKSWQKFSR
jgi:O-antigen/teichoic acid export membrane protein